MDKLPTAEPLQHFLTAEELQHFSNLRRDTVPLTPEQEQAVKQTIQAMNAGLHLGAPRAPEYVKPIKCPSAPGIMNQADIEYFAILDELREVKEKRGAVYGHFSEDYERVAALHKLILNLDMDAKQALMQMVIVKLSRLAVSPDHEDSIIDAVNYLLFILAMIRAEKRGDGRP